MKKTAIILLFVMIFNMLPVMGAAMPHTIKVSFDDVDVAVDGSTVKITGAAEAGTNVSLVVKDQQGNRVYINQQKSNSSGYVFEFKLGSGKYKAYVSTDVAGEHTRTADFEVKEGAVYDGYISPEKGSTKNFYNVDVTMRMNSPVELTAPGSKVQVTVEGISMREDRPEREDYTKEFYDVLVLDSTKTVIKLDLSREGERLDADYSYTIKITNGAVLQNGSPIDFTDNYWTFDTEWTGTDYSIQENSGAIDNNVLYETSNFLGLYVGNKVQLEKNSILYENYPFNWEGYPANAANVDRNGLLTAKEPGVYHMAGYPGLLDTANYNSSSFIHVREPLEGKVLLQSSKTGFVRSADKRVFSEAGYIYYREGAFIKRMDLDFKVDDTYAFNFNPQGARSVNDMFIIEGREYLYVEDMLYDSGYLMDIETGEIYVDNLPMLLRQVEKGSSLFVCGNMSKRNTELVDLSGGQIKTIVSHDRRIADKKQVGVYGDKVYMLDADGLTCYGTSGERLFAKALADMKDSSVSGIFIDSEGFLYISYPTASGYTLSKRSGADGSEIWSKSYKSVSEGLYEDSDGGIYFNIAETVEGSSYFVKTRLVKLDPDDGSIMREYTTGDVDLLPRWQNKKFKFLGEDSREYLYTSTVILDEKRDTIAYTDITSSSGDRGVNAIALVNDSLYREAQRVTQMDVKMEKFIYTADYEQIPTYIRTEERVSLYEGKELNLTASVLDQYGIVIPSAKAVYELKQGENILTLSSSGKVMAVADIEAATGKVSEKAVISVYMEGRQDIVSQIEAVVKQTPIAAGIYAVNGAYFTLDEYEGNYVESVDLLVYGLVGFHIFVADQHGDYMPGERVSSSIEDSSIAALQQRDSNNKGDHRHITIIGREKGTTSVDVWVTSNDKIKITIPVSIAESNYTILWERPAEGSWDSKRLDHAEGIYDDLIYVDMNKLYAVNKDDGTDIWQQPCEVAAVYGMEISYPILDNNGIIYMFDYNSLSVAAVESRDGSILWGKSYGRGIIKEFEVRDNYIYMLSDGGILYVLNKDGSLKEQLNIKGAASMDVSADEIIYVSAGNILYRVSENKTEVLHTFEDKSVVALKHITADGNIMAEVKSGNTYNAAYVSSEGELLWKNPVKKSFTAASDDGGDIYLYAFAYDSAQSYLYGYKKDGSVKFADEEKGIVNLDRSYARILSNLKERPPVIKNGIVYTHGMEIVASSADNGRTLWKTYIKDQYNITSPLTLTIGDDGVIYAGTGFRGLFAYTVGGEASSGINIYLKGRPQLINNAMNTISFTVRNGTLKTIEDLIISADLVNSSTGETRAAAFAVRDLLVDEYMPEIVERDISFNINVPADGDWYVLLKLSSADEVYDEVKINLK